MEIHLEKTVVEDRCEHICMQHTFHKLLTLKSASPGPVGSHGESL